MMLEVAGRLGRQPRPARDILFLATTAEEVGLLGAEYFAAHPAVPRRLDRRRDQHGHGRDPPGRRAGRGDRPRHRRRSTRSSMRPWRRWAAGSTPTTRPTPSSSARTAGSSPRPASRRSWSAAPSPTWRCSTPSSPAPITSPTTSPAAASSLDGAAEDANLLVALGRRLADPARLSAAAARPAR